MSATPTVNERLARLTGLGTAVWLDQIRRSLITSGELERLVREDSLRGVTSNPAIFEKAILGSPDYDDQLEQLAIEGATTREVYRAIAIQDVGDAADVLRAVHDETGDGFVSLEVDPDLAFDTEQTLAQAREYWAELARPNVMIKIPGTSEGLPAIEQALYEGINVNVTLLFGVDRYEKVMEAYVSAMERRHAEGLALDVHSVASFFVSRVDSEVDKRLENMSPPARPDLAGRAGLANARAAYQAHLRVFAGDRFAALREAGCPVQRPLWASTGTKNPAYSDVLYVEGLAGPDTVNTMPMPTLLAAAEHGEFEAPTCTLDPSEDLRALADAGIDLHDVTEKLLRDGVEAFVTPMEALLAGIEIKREAIVTGRPETIESSIPDDLEGAIAARVRRAAEEEVARRIWRRDDTLWGEAGAPETADRLGWLTIAESLRDEVDELETWAAEARAASDRVVLLGMGGSSLAPEVFRRSFDRELLVVDTTDPDAVRAVPTEGALYVVSSKSGGTIETLSAFAHLWEATGGDGSRFVAITDPGSSLEALGRERGFRRVFRNDPEIGGRYSALSYFGIVPAVLAGCDVRAVLEGAGVAEQACAGFDSSRSNSGLWLGLALGELALHGRDKLTFVVDPPIDSFGLWVEQLVAESLGKHGQGILPVADEPLGAPEAYGEDRVFVHLRDEADSPHADAVAALARAGHPVLRLDTRGPADLGRVMFFAEFATAVAGWVLAVNPFDQPDVQSAKDATARVLEQGAGEIAAGSLAPLLEGAAPPAYLAVLGYLAPDPAVDAAVADLRAAVRDRTRMTTTFGYGPRYLHSTGQLHKGGPPTGRFLQLVRDDGQDLPIPGRDFGFAQLIRAQADGDLLTLRERGLPVERIVVRGDAAQAVRDLAEAI